jgi:hypothetical protein
VCIIKVISEALILNAFCLDDDDDDMDITRAWETIHESINISAKDSPCYYELSSIRHG